MVASKIRVCMFTYNFLPEYSGAAIQCYNLLRNFERTGIEAFVITLSHDNRLKKAEYVDGIRVERIWDRRRGRFNKRIRNPLAIVGAIYRNRKKMDILHCHVFNLWALLAGKLLGKKIVLKQTLLGSDDMDSIRKQSWGKLKFYLVSKVDLIVCISSRLGKIINKYKQLNSRMLPNAVDIDRFCPPPNEREKAVIREKLNLPLGARIVVFAGPIIYRKGIDVLMASWKSVCGTYGKQGILLLIGPEYNPAFSREIREFLSEHNLSGKVRFIGQVTGVERYLRAADIFVFPTRREGMPNALMEAMASGLPCVVSKLEAITDVVINNGVDGLLITPGDEEMLSQALLRLLNDGRLRKKLGVNARKRIVQDFEIKKLAAQYIECYQEVLRQQ